MATEFRILVKVGKVFTVFPSSLQGVKSERCAKWNNLFGNVSDILTYLIAYDLGGHSFQQRHVEERCVGSSGMKIGCHILVSKVCHSFM